jgi:transposase
VRQEILVGVERRRRWSDEQKLRILAEVGVHGAGVSEVARRHDISRQHIYQWRHEMRRKSAQGEEPTVLLPVNVLPEPGLRQRPGRGECLVEIRLANGRGLCVDAAFPDAALQRLIRVVESA